MQIQSRFWRQFWIFRIKYSRFQDSYNLILVVCTLRPSRIAMSNFWQISRYLNPALQIYFLRWKVCWRSKKPTEAEIPPFDQPCLGDKLQRRIFYSWNFDWRVTTHPKVWNVKRGVYRILKVFSQQYLIKDEWNKQKLSSKRATSKVENWKSLISTQKVIGCL